ncbi:MAG: hypothetical protein WA678_08140 [Rhabdochlamydiaceae bacterium]
MAKENYNPKKEGTMKLRILGIIILLAGIASIFFSNYITTQINEGKIKIEKGQKTVDQSNSLFSLNPYSKQVGQGMTSSAQKKIDEGKNEVARYEQIASTLQIFGIAGIVVGAGVTLFSFFGSRKNRG